MRLHPRDFSPLRTFERLWSAVNWPTSRLAIARLRIDFLAKLCAPVATVLSDTARSDTLSGDRVAVSALDRESALHPISGWIQRENNAQRDSFYLEFNAK